jgi:tryptophan-rich sensory protein
MPATIIAFTFCAAAAILEGILAGRGAREYLRQLRNPRFSPSLSAWIVVGACYYLMCFLLLQSVLANSIPSLSRMLIVGLLLLMMLANVFWNFLFFRLRSLRYSFIAFLPYGLLVLVLGCIWIQTKLIEGWLLVPYFGYLIGAAWWSYRLWQLNEPEPR